MKTDPITDPTLKAVIDALQAGDSASWSALFDPHVTLLDDGNPRDFLAFTRDALGHERFTSIDHVSPNGREVRGHFHSDRWGDFVSYFRITVGASGKVRQLEIGQAT